MASAAAERCNVALQGRVAAVATARKDLAEIRRAAKANPTPENDDYVMAAEAALAANEAGYDVSVVAEGCSAFAPPSRSLKF